MCNVFKLQAPRFITTRSNARMWRVRQTWSGQVRGVLEKPICGASSKPNAAARERKSQILCEVSRRREVGGGGWSQSQSAGLCVHRDPDGRGVQTSSPTTTTTTIDPLAELDSQDYRWEGVVVVVVGVRPSPLLNLEPHPPSLTHSLTH